MTAVTQERSLDSVQWVPIDLYSSGHRFSDSGASVEPIVQTRYGLLYYKNNDLEGSHDNVRKSLKSD